MKEEIRTDEKATIKREQNELTTNLARFQFGHLNAQRMPWHDGVLRLLQMNIPLAQLLFTFLFLILSAAIGSSEEQSPSYASARFAAASSNYAAPATDGTAQWPESEREMAQLAMQELLQLQMEQQRTLGTKNNADRHKKTQIWPYSLYEQQMAKIFVDRKSKEKEEWLKTNTPVIIHLPAYRGTGDARRGEPNGGGAARTLSARQRTKPSPFYRTESNRYQEQRNNPIRSQSTRWHRPSNGGDKFSLFEMEANEGNILSNGNGMLPPTRLKSSSAEHSLITRPESMFMPMHANRNGPRPAQLRPIEPINGGTTDHLIQQKKQFRRIPSDVSAFSQPTETAAEGAKRLSPPANSAFISAGALPSPPASVPSMPAHFASPLSSAAAPVPLMGSPFDFMGPSVPNSAAVQPNALLSQLPNPLQLLSQGSTLEQITSLARNLIQMSNGKNDLLSSLSKAIGPHAADSATSKLTSTAVQSIAKSASKVAAQGEKTVAVGTVPGGDSVKTLFSSSATNNGTNEEQKELLLLNGTSSDLLNGLPAEQRILLEAAMKNGELNLAQTANEMNGSKINPDEATFGQGTRTKLVNSESRLMEWIQQNRPRPGTDQQNSQQTTSVVDKVGATIGAEKLPYYGKYCGHFVERSNLSRHNVAGAVWAIDERRLLISKFHFQPFEQNENVTFWAGPAKRAGTSHDFFPSENGIFLSPTKLDADTFALWPVQKMPAHTRAQILPINGKNNYGVNGTKQSGKTAEEEEDEDKETGTNQIGTIRSSGRTKRNLYSELYDQMAPEGTTTKSPKSEANLAATTATSIVANGTTKAFGAVVPLHFEGMPQSFYMDLGGTERRSNQQQKGAEKPIDKSVTTNDNNALAIDPPGAEAIHFGEECHWTSLGWNVGTQPLLLTLPDNNLIKMLNWLSVWDHVQKQAIALVLIPSSAAGAAFQPPSAVQLRPLPSPNLSAGKRLQSGSIRVLDTKTIELTEFSLSAEGMPLWFMVGKEIVPNRNGHIVPVFNREKRSFDCDSLRDFHNETVILRLPDPFDMKDVFWFSVYSIPRSQSLAHIYVPYNDMQLPPDLLAFPTPQCVWSSSSHG